jgi:hypothetical protein
MTGRNNIHMQLHQNSLDIETKQTNSDVAHKPRSIVTTAVLPPGSAMLTQIVIPFP